jgi:methionine synthase I (cobalamin-dependent)
MADEIVAKTREAGITLMDSDANTILEEVWQHPKEVKQAFEILRSAFQAHVRAHR